MQVNADMPRLSFVDGYQRENTNTGKRLVVDGEQGAGGRKAGRALRRVLKEDGNTKLKSSIVAEGNFRQPIIYDLCISHLS